MQINNYVKCLVLATLFNLTSSLLVMAQMNGLNSPMAGAGLPGMPIGTGMPGSPGSLTDPGGPANGALNMQNSAGASPSEYTEDEKRMQKKHKEFMNRAKKLVAQGDKMMKDGKAHNNSKQFKKGRVLKDIGEKQLETLKASDPLESPPVLK